MSLLSDVSFLLGAMVGSKSCRFLVVSGNGDCGGDEISNGNSENSFLDDDCSCLSGFECRLSRRDGNKSDSHLRRSVPLPFLSSALHDEVSSVITVNAASTSRWRLNECKSNINATSNRIIYNAKQKHKYSNGVIKPNS